MKTKIRSPLSRRLALYIVLCSSVITLFLTVFQLYRDYQSDIRVIETEFEQIRNVHLKSIELTVWATDKDRLRTLLDGISNMPDIEFVSVVDEGGVISVGQIISENNVSMSYPLTYPHRGKRLDIGVLKVVANLDLVYARVVDRAVATLISNAVMIALVAGLMLFIFHFVVIRHLVHIADFVSKITLDRAFEPLALIRRKPDGAREDEFDQVVGSINHAANRVLRAFSKVRKAEGAQQQSEARFKDFAEVASDWFWEMGPDLRFTYFSPRFAEITGFPVEQRVGTSRQDHLPPDLSFGDAKKMAAHFADLEARRPFREFEYATTASPKTVRHVSVSGVPIHGDDGEFLGYRGTGTEITAKIKAEQALKESEARFKGFAEVASDWFWEMDENLRFSYFSDRFAEISGVADDALIGKTREESALDLEDVWVRRNTEDLEAHRPFQNFEHSRTRPDGKVVYMSTSGIPIFDAQGAFKGYRGTGTDVTGHKTMENQLRQAQRMEAIGQLTGGVAHDFNNLLGVMIGNAEMLESLIDKDDEARRNVDEILKAADRGASLTGRLLAFSRQQALSPQPVAIDVLVGGLEDMLQRTLGETVELSAIFGAETWEVLIDPHQFENALINLAINARDAMPDGGVLTIETANVTLDEAYAEQHEEIAPGDYVEVAVSDTGTGMPPDVLKKVFEPFFTTKDVGQGSGLGLSMVFGFVKQSRGHITIYSEVGLGTTVKLYMPLSSDAVAKDGPGDVTPEFARGSERILVVEDDESVRKIPVSILGKQGYEVVEAANGEDAIKCLEEEPPFDLLFTDVVLPGGMNGIDIAEQAAKIQPRIKVLYTTGYTENSVVHNGRLDPGVSLVNKPYRRAELLEKVRAALDEKSVLLIEDDRKLRATLKSGLEGFGYSVTTASGGVEGMTLIAANRFDVVVTDIVMEEGEGMETLGWIQKSNPEIPVIVISGHPVYLRGVKKMGATAAMKKPFRVEELIRVIGEVTRV
jgi:PAS domain S-box-containing protein